MRHLRHAPLIRPRAALAGVALACAVSLPAAVTAQDAGARPALSFGVTTSAVANSNRRLATDSTGSTFEYSARLDFSLTFATPIQQLEISGDIGLRTVSGSDSDKFDTGLVEPNLAISYGRQSRDAQLSVTLRTNDLDVSSSSIVDVIGVPDPTLVTEEGTRRSTVFDTELELRRRAPFGITLSSGYTGLRYSDTTALTDQDRFRLGVQLRFDLTPVMRATLDFDYSTFEDFGTPEGVRETYALNGNLRQDLRNGDMSLQLSTTSTPDGERHSISVGRSLTTPLWTLSGMVGLTRDIQGDTLPTASVNLAREFSDGALEASFSQRIASGVDDQEDVITTLGLSYNKELNALTTFNANLSYNETDPTSTGANTSSLSTIGIGLQRNLSADTQLNIGLQRRMSEGTSGLRTRDNQFTISIRRDLSARR